MNWGVLREATVSPGGSFCWQRRKWSWLMHLVIPVITILMLLIIVPCIINCLTLFFSAQVNKLQHILPVQQRYIKLQATIENIIHPQMGTAIRTPSLKASKRGWPNAPYCPSSAGSSQKDLDTPIPKELGLPSLEGGMLGRQNREKESKMAVAKRQGRAKPAMIELKQVRGPD